MSIEEIKKLLMDALDCHSIADAQAKLRDISKITDNMEFPNFMNLVDSEPRFRRLFNYPERDQIIFGKARVGDLEGIAEWIAQRINN